MPVHEFQGHYINQPYYKSGIMPPKYHEMKGVDGELWLRVELEYVDIHASIKPIYCVILNYDRDA